MIQNENGSFEHCWELFQTQLTGRLTKRGQGELLTDKQADQILRDCALDWASEETVCGRWFQNYEKIEPNKAQKIREILQGMGFRSVSDRKEIPRSAEILIPAAGFGAGALISHQMQLSELAQAAAAFLPAGTLYLVVKTLRAQLHEKQVEKQIEGYLHQLEESKDRICKILSQ